MLSIVNSHPRDENISFEEEDHKYTIVGLEGHPTSVTTLIHHYFVPFDADAVIDKMMASRNWPNSKYYGMEKDEIKKKWSDDGLAASTAGTIMHKAIEDFMNEQIVDPTVEKSKEYTMFQNFWRDLLTKYPSLKKYRSEWLVYDEDQRISGSIDCVMKDGNGKLHIIDWKRSKEIKMSNRYAKGLAPFEDYDDCNYSHYSLQLNFYRHILETKYSMEVASMMLVILHPNQENYQCIPVKHIDVASVWSELR